MNVGYKIIVLEYPKILIGKKLDINNTGAFLELLVQTYTYVWFIFSLTVGMSESL